MSKLVLAIIFNTDAVDPLSQALLESDYSVTKISSMGGFLRRQNTTFVIGVEEARLPGCDDHYPRRVQSLQPPIRSCRYDFRAGCRRIRPCPSTIF